MVRNLGLNQDGVPAVDRVVGELDWFLVRQQVALDRRVVFEDVADDRREGSCLARASRTGNVHDAHAPSRLEDERARRVTEIDWSTRSIVRAAREVNISVPISETMYRLMKAREAGWKINKQVH